MSASVTSRPSRLSLRALQKGEFGGLAGSTALSSLLAVFVPSVLLLVTSDASYAGASDAKIVDEATTRYALYLERVGAFTAVVALTQWVVVSVLALGVLLALRAYRPALFGSKRLRYVLAFIVSLVTVAIDSGFGAQRHPGLFLAGLSGSRLLQLAVEACAYLGPLLVIVSLAGYAAALKVGGARLRVGFAGVVAVVCAAVFGLKHFENRLRFSPFLSPEEGTSRHLKQAPAPEAKQFPNVLWIAVDSLRPDMIDADNTPNIAKLLSESVYFDNAIVPVPRTGPSWTAALTSLSPLSNGIETMFPSHEKGNLATIALPAQLASSGFGTMVTSEYAGEFFGRVDLGFQVKAVPRAELMQISGQMLMARSPLTLSHLGLLYASGRFTRAALPPVLTELVRGLPNFSQPEVLRDDVAAFLDGPFTKNRPAFMLAFYSQPHFPYTSSPSFAKRYHVSGSSAALAYGRDVVNETPITSKEDKEQLVGLYRSALAETDDAIGKLLETLEQRDRLKDTIIVLSADHGEGLYECATCVGHGDNLRGTMTLRVPLAFHLPNERFPKAAPKVISDYVSTLDIYPSLLELLGMRKVAIHEGQSLFSGGGLPRTLPKRKLFIETGEWLWETSAVPKDRVAYPPITEIAHLENDRIAIDPKFDGAIRAAKHRAVLAPPYKLTYEPTREGVRYHLYDIEHDPFDEHDLAQEKPAVLSELREALRREVLGHAFVLPVDDYFITRPPMPAEENW